MVFRSLQTRSPLVCRISFPIFEGKETEAGRISPAGTDPSRREQVTSGPGAGSFGLLRPVSAVTRVTRVEPSRTDTQVEDASERRARPKCAAVLFIY